MDPFFSALASFWTWVKKQNLVLKCHFLSSLKYFDQNKFLWSLPKSILTYRWIGHLDPIFGLKMKIHTKIVLTSKKCKILVVFWNLRFYEKIGLKGNSKFLFYVSAPNFLYNFFSLDKNSRKCIIVQWWWRSGGLHYKGWKKATGIRKWRWQYPSNPGKQFNFYNYSKRQDL